MAYLTRRPGGRWELRESRATAKGPRSRTLASFTTLTPEVIAHAQERARTPLAAADLRRLAARAGAPVEGTSADEAAAALLAELEAGRGPTPALRRMLIAALADGAGQASDAERAVAPWVAASPEQRGEALHDLLLLADRVPTRGRSRRPSFPRIESKAA